MKERREGKSYALRGYCGSVNEGWEIMVGARGSRELVKCRDPGVRVGGRNRRYIGT